MQGIPARAQREVPGPWMLGARLWGGTWVAQSVEPLTLGLSSGHDLMVLELEPLHWALGWQWSLLGILSLLLCLCPSPALSLSQK